MEIRFALTTFPFPCLIQVPKRERIVSRACFMRKTINQREPVSVSLTSSPNLFLLLGFLWPKEKERRWQRHFPLVSQGITARLKQAWQKVIPRESKLAERRLGVRLKPTPNSQPPLRDLTEIQIKLQMKENQKDKDSYFLS